AIAFVLVTGLHERNPFAFDGSDNVVRVILFWMLFVPHGNCTSIDAWRARRAGRALAEPGSAFCIRLVQLQLAWIYASSFTQKIAGETWRDGTALHYALGLDHLFTRPLGARLFNAAWLTTPATYLTLAFEGAF